MYTLKADNNREAYKLTITFVNRGKVILEQMYEGNREKKHRK